MENLLTDISKKQADTEYSSRQKGEQMEKSRAIELLKLAVPIKALTQQEYSDFVEAVNMGMDALEQPTMQPVATDTNVGDTISKTETVERLRGVVKVTVPITDYDGGYIDGIETGISIVSTMPPAQPEPHYDEWCDTCKEYDHERHCCPRWNHVIRTTLQDAQPEPKEGHWIPHETPDGGIQYECSRCGVLWEFNDGTPEDNEAYFCPRCGKKLKGV